MNFNRMTVIRMVKRDNESNCNHANNSSIFNGTYLDTITSRCNTTISAYSLSLFITVIVAVARCWHVATTTTALRFRTRLSTESAETKHVLVLSWHLRGFLDSVDNPESQDKARIIFVLEFVWLFGLGCEPRVLRQNTYFFVLAFASLALLVFYRSRKEIK